MKFEELLKSQSVDLLKVREAGCVVFYFPTTLTAEESEAIVKSAKEWGKSTGVNVLIVPNDIKVEVIPQELVTKPKIYDRVNLLERQMEFVIPLLKKLYDKVENVADDQETNPKKD